VTGAAKARRPRESSETPDLTLVQPASAETLKKALEKSAPAKDTQNTAAPEPAADGAAPKAARRNAVPPVATTEDPWRYLHPSRVWPD
jgi:hypothetical protein